MVATALLAGVWSAQASAVLGGRAISVRSAPWTVSLRDVFSTNETFNCTGVILDSLHVLTAAHCLFNSSGLLAPLSQITVRAGVSNFRHARPADRPQVRKIASVRFFSGYVWRPGGESVQQVGTDVAVVRLSRPLSLDGTTASAITLPSNSARRPSGSGFVLAGFGREENSRDSSGALNVMTLDVFRAPGCSSARTLCGTSPASSSCPGDSGAGLVRPGQAPTLVGVLITGWCARGGTSGYVDVAAKPILRFIEGGGGSATPVQPRATRWVPAGWLSQPSFARNGSALPVVVSLPRSWITGATPDGNQNVWNPLTQAEENVDVIGSYPTRADFFRSILKSSKRQYVGQDRDAAVRSRIVDLPVGPGLELIAHLAAKIDGREFYFSIENYNLFHDGVGYDVEYQGPPSRDGVDVPVWQASARTIRFIAAPRPARAPGITPTSGSPMWTPLPGWAPWTPAGSTEAVTAAIVRDIVPQYRLSATGPSLLSIGARPVVASGASWASFAVIAIHPPGAATPLRADSTAATWIFRLCGSGADCAIGSGTATILRGRLVRREALELALYTFEYAPAVGAVIVELPPPPASGPSRLLLYFRRTELEKELRRPLAGTLRLAVPPLPTQPDASEARRIDALTLPEAYTSTVLVLADGRRALLLTPVDA